MACRICGAEEICERVTAREMMFGSREEFDYFRCASCGTLQIAEIPDDLGRSYESSVYYSFNNYTPDPLWKNLLKRWAAVGLVGNPSAYPHGNGIADRIRRGAEPWIATIPGLTFDSAILDVGCGEGARLEKLAKLGFANLTGIDAFLPSEREGKTPGGVELIRAELSDHDRRYDCITMHHSLEHVPDPKALLAASRDRLYPRGKIFVPLPLLQEEIWEKYGADWAQIDAPRHLYLFTPDGFVDFARRAGLQTLDHGTDTLGWSLAWSEAWARDIPANNPDGSANRLPFTRSEIDAFEAEAKSLNARGKGDQGYFVLEPA